MKYMKLQQKGNQDKHITLASTCHLFCHESCLNGRLPLPFDATFAPTLPPLSALAKAQMQVKLMLGCRPHWGTKEVNK